MKPEDSCIYYVDVCDFAVAIVHPYRFKKYIAKICGSDDVYGFARRFLRFTDRTVRNSHVTYSYGELPDGVYEASVKYYNPHESGTTIFRDRKILIVYREESTIIPYDSISKKEVLSIAQSIMCRQFNLVSD